MRSQHPQSTTSSRLALYARVSSGEQEKQATIDSQVSGLRRRAADDGSVIVEEYFDNPYTGTTLQRPALDRLRTDARTGHFESVLIHDPDRLSRGKPYLRAMVEDELRGQGITVTYLNYEVEDTPEGRAKDGMLSVFAEWEREKILERTRRGKLDKLANGHLWRSDKGRRPFGWHYIKPENGERHGHLVHDPDEAPLVRWMFEQIAAGRSAHRLAADMNQRGLTTTMGGPWRTESVCRVIHNPLHTGIVPTNRWQTMAPKTPRTPYRKRIKSVARERPREEWTTVTVPAIVTPELAARAEAMLTSNRRATGRVNLRKYLLSGLVHCANPRTDQPDHICGRVLQGYHPLPSQARRYTCTRQYFTEPTHVCKNRVSADVLEAWVWQQLVAILQRPHEILAELEQREREGGSTRTRLQRESERTATALDAAQAKLDKLVRRNVEGALDDETFDRMQPALMAERDDARLRVRDAHAALADATEESARWGDIRGFCTVHAARLAELEQPAHFEERQALVRVLVKRIEVRPLSDAKGHTRYAVRLVGVLERGAESDVMLLASAGWPRPEASAPARERRRGRPSAPAGAGPARARL